MLRRLTLVAVLSLSIAALDIGFVRADDPTTTTDSTTSTTDASGTSSTSTTDLWVATPNTMATRGTAAQVTPTQPPPPTTAAPVITSPPPPSTDIPANSGSGRRAIYSKSRQRVWIVEGDGSLVRTYLVSGRMNQPNPGTYHVFSRSAYTCSIVHTNVCMRFMVRFTKGPTGDNIGFHEIPRRDGVPLQKDSQLGQALSGGCVRQATGDAELMWAWAGIGTTVVVIA